MFGWQCIEGSQTNTSGESAVTLRNEAVGYKKISGKLKTPTKLQSTVGTEQNAILSLQHMLAGQFPAKDCGVVGFFPKTDPH